MIINNRYEEPYNKFPEDGPIPLLSKPIVISKLSKKFWLYTQYLRNENLIRTDENIDEKENNYNDLEGNNYIEEMPEKINIKRNNNINKRIRPKSNINTGNYNNRRRNNKLENENIYEIDQLNELIFNLQNELNKQDFIINSQINEKMRLTKRIHELEQVLNNFC